MKKFMTVILLSAILLSTFPIFGGVVLAEDAAKSITFAWDDTNPKAEGYHWTLFRRAEGEAYNYSKPAATIDYVPGSASFVSTQVITVTGNPGDVVKEYFVIRANTATASSSDSNEVSQEFTIPLSAPFSLTVTVTVTAN